LFSAKVHRYVYLVLLSLLGGTMVCSTWAANLMWVLLGVNWLLEGWSKQDGSTQRSDWRTKWDRALRSRVLRVYLAFFLLLLAGMLWSTNLQAGWSILRVSLPLAIVPLVILTSAPVTGRARDSVLGFYGCAVLVVSVIAAIRLFTIPFLPYREAVPYISHIRFALNCCLVICFCVEQAWRRRTTNKTVSIVSLAAALWLLAFLVLIRSFTAIAVLTAISLVVTLVYRRRWWTIAIWVAAIAGITAAVAVEVYRYYDLPTDADGPLPTHTANGRPYVHARDGMVENGNYVNNYVCLEELRSQWEQRSALPYDGPTATGFGVQPTLIRYLNGLGLTKDSAGVATLTDQQVEAIERGVANPVYEEHNQLRKMVYVLLIEREYHRHFQAVAGFTIAQRLELWQATMQVIADHPLFGAGTGDAIDEMHTRLAADGSELTGTTKCSHNQYLTTTSMIGMAGLAVIVILAALALAALLRQRRRIPPLMLAWGITILISFITEDTLDTLAGILLSTWFLAFRRDKD